MEIKRSRSTNGDSAPNYRHWNRTVVTLAIVVALLWMWIEPSKSAEALFVRLIVTFLALVAMVVVVSTANLRGKLHGALLIIVSTVLTIAILEGFVILGVLDGQLIFQTAPSSHPQHPRNRADPELFYVRKPQLRFEVIMTKGNAAHAWCLPPTYPEVRHVVDYDEHGFRNAPGLKQADVVLIGDSFLEDGNHPKEDAFPTQLTDEIGRPVANLGLGGYGPQQQLVVLKRYGLPLQPQVVFWFFYEGNDLNDALAYVDRVKGDLSIKDKLSSFRKRSIVRNAARKLHSFRCQPNPIASLRYGIFSAPDGRSTRMYILDPMLPLSETDEGALNILADVFNEGHKRIEHSGAELVVVFIPTKDRVYRDVLRFPEESYLTSSGHNSVAGTSPVLGNELPERIRGIVEDISPKIHYLDLTPAMKDQIIAGIPILYHSDDTHWSKAGHRLVAETLEEFLVEEGLLAD